MKHFAARHRSRVLRRGFSLVRIEAFVIRNHARSVRLRLGSLRNKFHAGRKNPGVLRKIRSVARQESFGFREGVHVLRKRDDVGCDYKWCRPQRRVRAPTVRKSKAQGKALVPTHMRDSPERAAHADAGRAPSGLSFLKTWTQGFALGWRLSHLWCSRNWFHF